MVRSAVTLAIYVAVNLVVAVLWHLVLFKQQLDAAVPFARPEPIIASGMAAMFVIGVLLIRIYPRFHQRASRVRSGIAFGAQAGLFLAAGAVWVEVGKFQFADSWTYLVLETVYEVLSFSVLGLVIALRYDDATTPLPN